MWKKKAEGYKFETSVYLPQHPPKREQILREVPSCYLVEKVSHARYTEPRATVRLRATCHGRAVRMVSRDDMKGAGNARHVALTAAAV